MTESDSHIPPPLVSTTDSSSDSGPEGADVNDEDSDEAVIHDYSDSKPPGLCTPENSSNESDSDEDSSDESDTDSDSSSEDEGCVDTGPFDRHDNGPPEQDDDSGSPQCLRSQSQDGKDQYDEAVIHDYSDSEPLHPRK